MYGAGKRKGKQAHAIQKEVWLMFSSIIIQILKLTELLTLQSCVSFVQNDDDDDDYGILNIARWNRYSDMQTTRSQ